MRWLRAAERAVARIPIEHTPEARAALAGTRARIMALANRLPVDWRRPRDERGRFAT